MTYPTLIALVVTVCGGAAVALQAPINAALADGLRSTIGAAAVSFAVGLVALLVVLVLTGDGAALGRVASVNPWLLVGGFLGSFYVWSIVFAVPVLGVLTAISAVVLGQLLAALVLDAMGPFGLQAIEITWQRVAGVVLVGAGLILSKL
ncbi:DMT family transporter [Thalassorhabdomicrobium marinisediminis]|uniref:DMT family transporter n=1 Tax=Thalassorhabdomicrobium marinisediminis TaxID=2170577 RepID=UPI0024919DDA|nr:DMT family transporter [Thalassorhabdomicrobium marinisediminis]